MQEIERALVEGAKRSREACSNPLSSAAPSGSPAEYRRQLWQYVWPRYKWLIIGAALFLLIDIVVMSGFGSTTGGW
jgi:hypothetical protein